MSDLTPWLVVWPVAIPLIAAAAAATLWGRPGAQRIIGIVGLGAQFAAASVLFAHVWSNGPLALSMGGWPAPFGIALAADALGAGLTLAASFVAALVLLHSFSDTTRDHRCDGFYPLVLALMTGVAGAFLTSDVFNLYVWFEVTLIASFGLIVLGGRREQIDGAVKYAFLNLLATTVLLIAIGLLYGLTGTLNMADLSAKTAALPNDAALETIALLFLLSLGMKSALFPLYFWLPAAYHTPLSAVSAIFAALLTKVGVYSLIRVFSLVFPESGELAREALLWAAVATMVLGALGALAETDIRRLVSYTVVSGVGVMAVGLAIGSDTALMGSIFYIVHSMVIAAAMFVAAGLIVRAGQGATGLASLAGLYKSAPLLAVGFFIAALSLAGVPPLAGFWPKVFLVQAGLEAQSYAAVAGVLAAGFLTLVAVGRTFALVFWREREAPPPPVSGAGSAKAALCALALASFAIGVQPEPVIQAASRAADGLLQPEAYIAAVLGESREAGLR